MRIFGKSSIPLGTLSHCVRVCNRLVGFSGLELPTEVLFVFPEFYGRARGGWGGSIRGRAGVVRMDHAVDDKSAAGHVRMQFPSPVGRSLFLVCLFCHG